MSEDDEVALNVMLLNGIDLPSAVAALPHDDQEPPPRTQAWVNHVVLAVLVGFILWLLIR